jgi:hypothetical protein
MLTIHACAIYGTPITPNVIQNLYQNYVTRDYENIYNNNSIIGGDSTSRDLINNILELLARFNYKITFAHILDSTSNSFAINCITGETYLNDEIIPTRDILLTKEHNEYLTRFELQIRSGIEYPLEEIKMND